MNRLIKHTGARIAARTARLAAIAALAVMPACAEENSSAQNEPALTKAEQAFKALEARGFTGIVAVAENDKTPAIRRIGDVSDADVPPGETQVDSGSITKTFTAAAALKLVDMGKLSTSDRLDKYFPDAPADKAGITIHQLLTHSSGLPGAIANDHDVIERAGFIEKAMKADLGFAPGEEYSYSNVGYSLIAVIIEQLSCKSYEAFLREDLLGEYGLNNIGYVSAFDSDRSIRSEGREMLNEVSWGGDKAHWALIGNGGLTLSADDMIRFRKLFTEGKIVSLDSVALAQTPHVLEGEGAPTHYGYGLVVEDHPDFGRNYWHNGGNSTFSAIWQEFEEPGLVIFAASSSPNFFADFAAMTIAEVYFDKKIFPDDFDYRMPRME